VYTDVRQIYIKMLYKSCKVCDDVSCNLCRYDKIMAREHLRKRVDKKPNTPEIDIKNIYTSMACHNMKCDWLAPRGQICLICHTNKIVSQKAVKCMSIV